VAIYVAAVDGMTSHDAGDVTSFETSIISQEGVVLQTGSDLEVEAQDTPDMSVKVNKGSCYVLRDAHIAADNSLKFWKVIVTTTTNVDIPAADPSNPRIDLICVKIDTGASPDATASNVASLVNIEGTPSASPSAPSVPANHLKLAEVSVPASDTTIENGQITDYRTFVGLVTPYSSGYRLTDTEGNLEGQLYEDSSGRVILKSSRSGGAIKIDPLQNKVQIKGREGESYADVGNVTLDGVETLTNKTLTAPVLTAPVFDTEATFDAEYDNGNSGSAKTIDWTNGNKQKLTVTENTTLTFTDPSGPCNLILKLVNGGAYTITWPGEVKWTGGTEPSWTSSGTDVVAFYFDGNNYYGQGALDFS